MAQGGMAYGGGVDAGYPSYDMAAYQQQETHSQAMQAMSQERREALRQKDREQGQEEDKRKRKADKYRYRTLAELKANNPSIKDGLEPDKELKWRRQYCKLLQEAGVQLRIPQWGIAVGIILCHRFFAAKSMKKNDRFLIATACLFLAAKIEEAPRQLRNVILEVERVRHQGNPAATKPLDDPAHMERMREEVLQAERAVLYTLGFDLNIQHPYKSLITAMTDYNLNNLDQNSPYRQIIQNAWNIVNDSLRTTLCLQFPSEKIGATALWISNILNVASNPGHEPRLPMGEKFYNAFHIQPQEVKIVAHQMISEYESSKTAKMLAVAVVTGQVTPLKQEPSPTSAASGGGGGTPVGAAGAAAPTAGATLPLAAAPVLAAAAADGRSSHSPDAKLAAALPAAPLPLAAVVDVKAEEEEG